MTDLPAAFSPIDLGALIYFVLAWVGYGLSVGRLRGRMVSLSQIMNAQREDWARQLIARDNRVVDTTINASLQNGTAFFASTSLIALGGVLTLSRSGDDVLNLFAHPALRHDRTARPGRSRSPAWRSSSSTPSSSSPGPIGCSTTRDPARRGAAEGLRRERGPMLRAARRAAMNIGGGRSLRPRPARLLLRIGLSRVVREPDVLLASTTAVVLVMWRRQFVSEIRTVLLRTTTRLTKRSSPGCEREPAYDRRRPEAAIEETMLRLVAERGPGQDDLSLGGRPRARRLAPRPLEPADAAGAPDRRAADEGGPPGDPAQGQARRSGRFPRHLPARPAAGAGSGPGNSSSV